MLTNGNAAAPPPALESRGWRNGPERWLLYKDGSWGEVRGDSWAAGWSVHTMDITGP